MVLDIRRFLTINERISAFPYEGKGDRLRWMRCQPGRRTLLFSLSFTLDSDLTANLSLALRAARVEAVCPSEAAVRALNLCGGVNPSNPPLPAMGSAPPALVKASTRPRSNGVRHR